MNKVVNFVCDRFPDPDGCRFIECENESGESIRAGEWRLRADGLVELHIVMGCLPLISALHENGDLIAAQATIAHQAQMIEHLRGGPTPGYTEVDMTTAAAQGFRAGVESMEPLRLALADCISSLECEMISNYHGQEPDEMHPSTRRSYDRDMAEVAEYRAILGKDEQP